MMNPSFDDAATDAGLNRRDLLAALLGITVAGGAWTPASAAEVMRKAGAVATGPALPRAALRTLTAAADVIAPRTTTPGAVQAGVPAFISVLYSHWMTGDERAVFTEGLAGLDQAALAAHRKGFAACTVAQRHALLQALREAQPFKGFAMSVTQRLTDPKAPFFTRLRDLVMFGFYTSQAGTTQALRYVPAPGSYETVKLQDWPYQMVL